MKTKIRVISLAICVVLIFTLAVSLVACNKSSAPKYEHFENDMLFSISDKGEVVGLRFGLFSIVIDPEESYFTFTTTGKIHGQLRTKTNVVELLGGLLSIFDMELSDITANLSDIDLDAAMVKPYVAAMFPGFSLDNLKDSFALMEKSLGLSLIGVDFEHPIVKEIEKTHRIPSDFVERLPEDFSFGIAFDNEYFIKEITDADGNTSKAVYVGDIVAKNENTQPFVIFTMSENKGKLQLELDVEFIMVKLLLVESM